MKGKVLEALPLCQASKFIHHSHALWSQAVLVYAVFRTHS